MADAEQKVDKENAGEENTKAAPKVKDPAPKDGDKQKVEVLLKAAGDAPIMKKKKWTVEGSKTIAYLIEFIRKYIRCEPEESLFLYVGQAFAPSPDQIVSNLYECFGADGKLVLHYCKSQAWG
ncbi:ubiquitin-like protein ATG12 [Exaiptasia diaphana]|uniref:Ubiquitin-like protein ATG12 n=1 Tax=Exaiptasia diaphana TaxID=2652724 RepID=A0A913X4X3_EXADI|nr:ubiquitin-like protein ATG12 [Exaiptasia diaphana]KXJ27139.1 Ubiquitin-like protein ATG12 [Exaiptasia diaphana]